jgi:ABC-type sugar transport system ATPase subunit
MTSVIPSLVMQAFGLVKLFGHVVALDKADFELANGEVLAVVGGIAATFSRSEANGAIS